MPVVATRKQEYCFVEICSSKLGARYPVNTLFRGGCNLLPEKVDWIRDTGGEGLSLTNELALDTVRCMSNGCMPRQ